MPAYRMPEGPSEQQRRRGAAQHRVIQDKTEGEHREQHKCNGGRMAERDRDPGQRDYLAAVAVQSERDAEQPPHRRVDAVEAAEPS